MNKIKDGLKFLKMNGTNITTDYNSWISHEKEQKKNVLKQNFYNLYNIPSQINNIQGKSLINIYNIIYKQDNNITVDISNFMYYLQNFNEFLI